MRCGVGSIVWALVWCRLYVSRDTIPLVVYLVRFRLSVTIRQDGRLFPNTTASEGKTQSLSAKLAQRIRRTLPV